MGSLSIWHWLIVLVIVMLLFGGNKFSALAGDVAKGLKTFKKEMKDDDGSATANVTMDMRGPEHKA